MAWRDDQTRLSLPEADLTPGHACVDRVKDGLFLRASKQRSRFEKPWPIVGRQAKRQSENGRSGSGLAWNSLWLEHCFITRHERTWNFWPLYPLMYVDSATALHLPCPFLLDGLVTIFASMRDSLLIGRKHVRHRRELRKERESHGGSKTAGGWDSATGVVARRFFFRTQHGETRVEGRCVDLISNSTVVIITN